MGQTFHIFLAGPICTGISCWPLAAGVILATFGAMILGSILLLTGLLLLIRAKRKHESVKQPIILLIIGVGLFAINAYQLYSSAHRFDSTFSQNIKKISFTPYKFNYLPSGYNVVRSGVGNPKDPQNPYLFYRLKDDSGGMTIHQFDMTKTSHADSNCGPNNPEIDLTPLHGNCVHVATTAKDRKIYTYSRGMQANMSVFGVCYVTLGNTRIAIELPVSIAELTSVVDGLEAVDPASLKFIQPSF